MDNKILRFLGYFATGLILFVATLIIIRWLIDFVTWSSLDSGWAQVIGSIAALGVAIYVMSRQNAHSARLVVEADTLALRRRTAAVSAIFRRAMFAAENAYAHASIPKSGITNLSAHIAGVRGSKTSIDLMTAKVEAIPAYELGSYKIVDSLTMLQGSLTSLSRRLQRIIDDPSLAGRPNSVFGLHLTMDGLDRAHEKFKNGAKEFD